MVRLRTLRWAAPAKLRLAEITRLKTLRVGRLPANESEAATGLTALRPCAPAKLSVAAATRLVLRTAVPANESDAAVVRLKTLRGSAPANERVAAIVRLRIPSAGCESPTNERDAATDLTTRRACAPAKLS